MGEGRRWHLFDLKVAGGTLVFPGDRCTPGDLGITHGRIVAIGAPGGLGSARQVVDAEGLHVMPGIIDPHIHLGQHQPFASECRTETSAALATGVTTLGCFLRHPDAYADVLPGWIATVNAQACTDLMFHTTISTEPHLAEAPRLAEEFGITSFKMYLFGVPGLIPTVDDGFLLAGMRQIAAMGPRVVICVHAENAAICTRAYAELPESGGTLRDWAQANPDFGEAEAVRRAAFIASVAGAHLYIVHLTSAFGLDELRTIRQHTRLVSVETTSTYLTLDVDDPEGLRLKRSPPVRTRADRDALWRGIGEGIIDTIGTDNVTRSKTVHHIELGVRKARGGYAALPTHVASVLEEGVHGRGLPLERVVETLTAGPARAFGIYPRKGTLTVGADADLALVDMDTPRLVDPSSWLSHGDWSPYEGRPLRGWSRTVIRAGAVAARDGVVLDDAPPGRYLARA